jgi:hypothetical protein
MYISSSRSYLINCNFLRNAHTEASERSLVSLRIVFFSACINDTSSTLLDWSNHQWDRCSVNISRRDSKHNLDRNILRVWTSFQLSWQPERRSAPDYVGNINSQSQWEFSRRRMPGTIGRGAMNVIWTKTKEFSIESFLSLRWKS